MFVPAVDQSLQQEIGVLQTELNNLHSTNKKIDSNKLYIEERNGLDFQSGLHEPAEFEFWDEYQTLKQDLMMLKRDIGQLDDISNIKNSDTCPAMVKQSIHLT